MPEILPVNNGSISNDEYALARYFSLTPQDHKAIAHCRGDHNRLGFACQIGWLRWLGWQPIDLKGAPATATTFLAQQLNLSPASLFLYGVHARMWRLHAEQVREHLGWRPYHASEEQALAKWLLDEALQHDHARGLFESTISYLRREHIVRPGLTVLERLVLSVRGQADTQLA